MLNRFKKILAFMLSFAMAFTLIPMESLRALAASDITIERFDYIQTNDAGNTNVRVVIMGENFLQNLGSREESVIRDILVTSGTETKSLMQGDAVTQGVKVNVTDSLITITAPKTGDFATLNINTNASNRITINTRGLSKNTYRFDVRINNLPSMSGSLDNKRNYVGQELTIKGANFTGVVDTVIAGASHDVSTGEMIINSTGTEINIPKLIKGTLNKDEKIQFIKKDITSNIGSSFLEQPVIQFTAEYINKILVFEKLVGMDNLEVLPSEGPHSTSSKITVRARDNSDNLLKNIFNTNNELYLRRTVNEVEQTLKLTDIKLIYEIPDNTSSPVVGIEGWTPSGTRPAPSTWDLVVKDKGNVSSEGVKANAYTFSTSNPAPQITGISPAEGPDTGGTDVLITGRNIINVNTPGIKLPTGFRLVPSGNTTVENNDTLVINYDVPSGTQLKYGDKNVSSVKRKIKVRIASMTNAHQGGVFTPSQTPSPGTELGGISYGKYHYMSGTGTDGLVVTTTNASTGGAQDVIMDMDTIFTFTDGSEISIPEAARYKSFTYNEKNPTPVVNSVSIDYGFFNDSGEEDNPTGANDGVKPIMLRITGDKFEAYQENGQMQYPTVQFVLPDNTVLPVVSSTAQDDTKVLDSNGNPIDGIYNKTGSILVVSVIPPSNRKYDLRQLIGSSPEQPGSYKNLEGIIQVTNPSGNHNTTNADGAKFQFRRPTEGSYTNTNSKQIEITQVTLNGAPLTKLPSDTDSLIEIRVKAVAGISDASKLVVTVDGRDISRNIRSTRLDGEETVISVNVPRGLVGKSRLQVIIPEGLMDSYQITFDNVRGPEIKELTPEEGDKGTIVVIKRDDQANEVSFKTPLQTSSNESERKGSVVLLNGIDINEQFDGYTKDGSGNVIYQKSDVFKSFKQEDKDVPSDFVNIPGKYVYVVDSNTIYLKIPEDANLKEGSYNIQIKNPDGSESSVSKIFKIVDTIDKTKIGDIIPNTDDASGGITATITAGVKDGIQTNFKGGVDVYIGSQKAEIIGYDIDNKEVYVKIPPLKDFTFPTALAEKVESYTVPVTIQNKVNKSTDTINDGFIYLNPNYNMTITQIYNEKYSTDPSNKEANKGVEGDFIIVRGNNLRLETDSAGNYVLPKVMFGYVMADTPVAFGAKNLKPDGSPQTDSQGRAELEWVKVKVPKQPTLGIGSDGSVDILVQNPDGAKTVKTKGFIYKKSSPAINQSASILQASRFSDTITISAKDINKDGLVVAFGNKKYEKELSSTEMQVETTNEVEKIVVKYIPNTTQNIEIYYKKPDGSLVLMTDAEGTTGGKTRLGAIGDKIVVGINWKNPNYHSTDITQNPDLISTLNTEYMEIYAENKAPNVNTLIVRRGLGKVSNFVLNSTSGDSQITVQTPYNDKSETTTVSLINADGSSATAPFVFHGGLAAPEITSIDGSKDRDVTIEGKSVKAKVYSSDYTSAIEITLTGKNFKDIQRVLVGTKEAEVISVSSDYTKLKIRVPAGTLNDVGVPQVVTVVGGEGTGYSDKPVPPMYFMYIQAGSKPVLNSVSPNKGPQTGGTKVTILGDNFRDLDEFGSKGEIEVYFAGVKGRVNRVLTNEKGEIIGIEAITPSVDMVDSNSRVLVKNADGGLSEGMTFRYISQPVIDKVEGNFTFYAEQGEDDETVEVTIVGKNFYNPSKVIIGGKSIKTDKNKDNIENSLMLGVKSDGSNQYVELETNNEGEVKGIEVNVSANKSQNTTSFTVTMPQITFEQMDNMSSKNIIVVNSDGGISPETAADIKLPVPEAPVVIAAPGYNNTVNLQWNLREGDRNKASRFEIYAKEYGSSNDYNHIGDLTANADKSNLKYNYTVKDLKPNTNYQFKVRVMNNFGEAEDFGYATVRTMSLQDDYKQQEKQNELDRANTQVRQNGTKTVVGDTLKYTIGTLENTIDLSSYTNVKTKEIRIPVSQIKTAPNTTIQVNDKNMKMNVPFRAFLLNQVTSASDNAVVSIKIQNTDNKLNTQVGKLIPKDKQRVTQVHKIEFVLEEPKKTLPITFTNAPINMNLLPGKNVSGTVFVKYNEKTDKLEQYGNSNITEGGNYVLLANK